MGWLDTAGFLTRMYKNFRFSVSFVVAKAVQEADGEQKAYSTNRLQRKSDTEGIVVIPFND